MCSRVVGGNGLDQQTAESVSWCDFGTKCCPWTLCRGGAGGFLEASPGACSHAGLNSEVCRGRRGVFHAAWPQTLGAFLGTLSLLL